MRVSATVAAGEVALVSVLLLVVAVAGVFADVVELVSVVVVL